MSWICVKHWPRTKFSIDPTAVQSPCLVETEPRTERTGTPFQYFSPWRMASKVQLARTGASYQKVLLHPTSPADYASFITWRGGLYGWLPFFCDCEHDEHLFQAYRILGRSRAVNEYYK